VLDGLLYNESDLDLEEHYTDTHGYTEINVAAFAMLGRRCCPRIRGLQKQLLYRLDVGCDYGSLAGLVGRADRTIDPMSLPSSGTGWGSSMRRWSAVTRPPRWP
jgi:TnpA family transposase